MTIRDDQIISFHLHMFETQTLECDILNLVHYIQILSQRSDVDLIYFFYSIF